MAATFRNPNLNHAVTDHWWHPQSPASKARAVQLEEIAEREAPVVAAAMVIALMARSSGGR